ncbi:MAG: vitamin K epoxide reductase family protein [Anaerolineales bacterium]|nr:vitamin K epoxide reductase family protein [Anaerolineales bacterium]
MKRKCPTFILAILIMLLALMINPRPVHAQTAEPIVRALLFYSPTCPRCVEVMEEYLRTLFAQYGHQLQIIGIDGTTRQGRDLYHAAVERFAIPEQQQGFPTLIAGETVMVGTWEIPNQFPDLIEARLARGGLDWPDIPGLEDVVEQVLASAVPTSRPALILVDNHTLTWYERYSLDLTGNTISVIVLAGMVLVLVAAALHFQRSQPLPPVPHRAWLIPSLCLLGLCVAGYLAYVETARVEAFCGPVGNCNTVQESQYARLFGILPIGVLGMLGYVAIIAAWFTAQQAKGQLAAYATLTMFAMTMFGILFSIYLTFLEPFVIGATCAWCLTSAIVMTLLFWFSIAPARQAWTGLSCKTPSSPQQKEP